MAIKPMKTLNFGGEDTYLLKPDWDDVDNRPFGETDPIETVLVDNETIELEDSGDGVVGSAQSSFTVTITPGIEYTVTWNGDVYTVISGILPEVGVPYIGNMNLGVEGDTGEPFMIIDAASLGMGTVINATLIGTATVSISAKISQVIPVPSKYLNEALRFGRTVTNIEPLEATFEFTEEMLNNRTSYEHMPALDIVEGGKYTVVWDGVTYECIAYMVAEAGVPVIGNRVIGEFPGEDTGEPFCIASMMGITMMMLNDVGTHTVSITGEYEEFNYIDPQYIEALEYSEVGSDTLTWDGDTTGLTPIEIFYKVSDAIITPEDVVNGIEMGMSAPNGMLMGAFPMSGEEVLGCFQAPNFAVIGEFILFVGNGAPIPIPAGVYFGNYPGEGYISSLKINGYGGFVTTSTKVKTEYLPEHLHFGKTTENVGNTLTWDGSDSYLTVDSGSDMKYHYLGEYVPDDGAITPSDFVGATVITNDEDATERVVAEDGVMDFSEVGYMIVAEVIVVVLQDNLAVPNTTITFPKKGIYHGRLNDGYIRSITVPSGTFVTTTVKKLDPVYLPDGIGGGGSSEHDHDDKYAAKDHNHDDTYAAKTHKHDDKYAPKTHNHDDTYAPKTHTHSDYMTKTDAKGSGSFSIGRLSGTTVGEKSSTLGYMNTASGSYSHAEGKESTASGKSSHAEGYLNTASGDYSHAEGYNTYAYGKSSHTEGYSSTKVSNSVVSGSIDAVVSKWRTSSTSKFLLANGHASHAEGQDTLSLNRGSHSEGECTVAAGNSSHSEGYYTMAMSDNQHAQGKYNIEDSSGKYAHIVGNGESDTQRSNAHTLDWDGNAWFAGNVTVGPNAKKLVTEDHEHDDKYAAKDHEHEISCTDLVEKPFELKGTPDTVTWDGNPGDRITVSGSTGSMTFTHYHISDAIPSLDDFEKGYAVNTHTSNGTNTEYNNNNSTLDALDNGVISGTLFIVIPKDNCIVTTLVGDMAFPKAGLYLTNANGTYVTSLTINGYTGFATTKLKEEYLPSGATTFYVDTSGTDTYLYVDSNRTTKATKSDVKKAIMAGAVNCYGDGLYFFPVVLSPADDAAALMIPAPGPNNTLMYTPYYTAEYTG